MCHAHCQEGTGRAAASMPPAKSNKIKQVVKPVSIAGFETCFWIRPPAPKVPGSDSKPHHKSRFFGAVLKTRSDVMMWGLFTGGHEMWLLCGDVGPPMNDAVSKSMILILPYLWSFE